MYMQVLPHAGGEIDHVPLPRLLRSAFLGFRFPLCSSLQGARRMGMDQIPACPRGHPPHELPRAECRGKGALFIKKCRGKGVRIVEKCRRKGARGLSRNAEKGPQIVQNVCFGPDPRAPTPPFSPRSPLSTNKNIKLTVL